MTQTDITHYIAYLSPAGTTKLVAETIVYHLQQRRIDGQMLDLAKVEAPFVELQSPCCLWIGSPVYVDHSLPQVSEFISKLPEGTNHYAVPFVTWGAVCSGVALLEMSQLLTERGWQTLAAAKVLALHSSMWKSQRPLGEDRPNADDLAHIALLVDGVLAKLATHSPQPLAESVLHYLTPEQEQQSWQKSLAQAKQMLGDHQPDIHRCKSCGTCVTVCPIAAIEWETKIPFITERCIRCHQCTRLCPCLALSWDGAMIEERLHAFAAASEEVAETQVFI